MQASDSSAIYCGYHIMMIIRQFQNVTVYSIRRASVRELLL